MVRARAARFRGATEVDRDAGVHFRLDSGNGQRNTGAHKLSTGDRDGGSAVIALPMSRRAGCLSLRRSDSQLVDHLRDARCLSCQSHCAVPLLCRPDNAGQRDDGAGRIDIDAARFDIVVEDHL